MVNSRSVRLRADGSIDFTHYSRRAARWRRRAIWVLLRHWLWALGLRPRHMPKRARLPSRGAPAIGVRAETRNGVG